MPVESVEITPACEPAPAASCRCAQDSGEIVLDVRTIPRAVRHGAVFGALESLASGQGLVLVAPHDPKHLLAQLELREPGAFAVEYGQRSESECRVRLTRR